MAKIVLAAIILMHLLLHRALPGFPGQLGWVFLPCAVHSALQTVLDRNSTWASAFGNCKVENSSVTVAGSMQYLKAVISIPGWPGGF